ncbi:MAG: heat-inducible transcription repressor HrcA [Clostridia bacterium]|nr:heat-inducible transcription repressor HrcA [Clostridia bacterium]
MELNERKRAILAAIIRAYAEHGEPVGSKSLCDLLDFSVSSATLRNEMSSLCELGYLEQPHTSAGRIPTVRGYKLYISDLMNRDTLSGEMKLIIDAMLDGISGETGDITARAGQILSELTGLPVITTSVMSEHDSVKKIEVIPMGRHSVLAVVVTSKGMLKNRICRVADEISPALIERFYTLCSTYIIGKPLSTLSPTYLQQTVALSGSLSLMSLAADVFGMISDIKHSSLTLRGESNLFRCYSRDGEVQRAMELLSQKDVMLSLFNKVTSPVGVLFGDDTEISELQPATLVIARYGHDGHELGKIGVIGPTRMSYDRVIPSLEYFASKMSKVITQNLTDLED